MGHVFISYSRQDANIVDELIRLIRGAGIMVWNDREGIPGGVQWRAKIVEAIESADVVLLALSSNSVGSDNVRREIDIAQELNKAILPIEIEAVVIPSGLMFQLAGIQRINLGIDFDAGTRSMLDRLSGLATDTTEPEDSVAAPPTENVPDGEPDKATEPPQPDVTESLPAHLSPRRDTQRPTGNVEENGDRATPSEPESTEISENTKHRQGLSLKTRRWAAILLGSGLLLLILFIIVRLTWSPKEETAKTNGNSNTSSSNGPTQNEQSPIAFKELAPIQLKYEPFYVALSSDGSVAASYLYPTTKVNFWRLQDRQDLPAMTVMTDEDYAVDSRSIAFNPVDGEMVAVGGDDGAVTIWKTGEAKVSKVLTEGRNKYGFVFALAFSADGRMLVSANTKDPDGVKVVQLWRISDWSYKQSRVTKRIVAINADQELIATTDNSKNSRRLTFTQIGSNIPKQVGGAFAYEITSLGAFSRDVQLLAAGVKDDVRRGALIWRVSDGFQLHSCLVDSDSSSVSAVAFSPDAELLALGWDDGQIQIWRVKDGKPLASLKKHDAEVYSIVFSENGRFLASAGKDNKIQLWEVTGKK